MLFVRLYWENNKSRYKNLINDFNNNINKIVNNNNNKVGVGVNRIFIYLIIIILIFYILINKIVIIQILVEKDKKIKIVKNIRFMMQIYYLIIKLKWNEIYCNNSLVESMKNRK